MTTKHWVSDGSGRLNLELTKDEAETGYHTGDCEDGVRSLLTLPHIKEQVAGWSHADMVANLRGYGAWEDEELADEDMTLARTVWLLCGDAVDGWEDYED